MSGFMCNTSVNVKLITVFKCAMFKKKQKTKKTIFFYIAPFVQVLQFKVYNY